MTLMFCAFTGDALILRVYGSARVITPQSTEWSSLYALFPPNPGARQIFELSVDMVQTSCGQAVPFFDYRSERDELMYQERAVLSALAAGDIAAVRVALDAIAKLRPTVEQMEQTRVRLNAYAFRARRLAAVAGYVATELAKEVPYYAGAFGSAVLSESIDSGDAIIFASFVSWREE